MKKSKTEFMLKTKKIKKINLKTQDTEKINLKIKKSGNSI
jgi:hypothetical protein